MRKILFILLPSLLLLSCADDNKDPEKENLTKKVDSLTTALEKEKEFADSLQTVFAANDSLQGGYPIFFGKKYEGIEDPEQFIENQLRNQPERIPLSPVVGGDMAFRKIDIISEKWLLAIYDDGHIQGKAIMEYELLPNGTVKYSIVATQE